MAGDLKTLSRRMNKLADSLPDRANEAKKHVLIEIATDLAYSTPVDTSQALSNWQGAIGGPNAVERPAFNVGKLGSTRASSAGAMIEEVKSSIAAVKPGSPLFLSNVLPYIRRLDQGYSRQAPRGFTYRVPIVGRMALDSFKFFAK